MSEAAGTSPDLPDDVAALKALVGAQSLEIERLKEQLRLAIRKLFAPKSEKADPDQLGLFNEAEVLGAKAPETAVAEIVVPEHTRKTGGRKPLSDTLPRVRVEYDIADADKLCPCGSGHARPRIGEVVSEQCDIIPAQVQVLQHVRFKYGPCRQCDGVFPEAGGNAAAGGEARDQPAAAPAAAAPVATVVAAEATAPVAIVAAAAATAPVATVAAAEAAAPVAAPAATIVEPRAVIVAPLPAQPIPKSFASPGTCAFIAIAKYADGLPLYRQEGILARYGMTVSRATLAAWMIRLGELIVPLMNLMEEVQLGYDVLQMDETTVQVLKEDGRAATTKSRMWVRRRGEARLWHDADRRASRSFCSTTSRRGRARWPGG